jgi:hypothetical protein
MDLIEETTEDERNTIAKAFIKQQDKLKSMRVIVKVESDKLRDIEQSLKKVLQGLPTHKIPIQMSTVNDGMQMTLLLKTQHKPEYLSKSSLSSLLYKFFTEKFGNSQTEKAISDISQEACNFIWTSRESNEKSCVYISRPRKKRKRSATDLVKINV